MPPKKTEEARREQYRTLHAAFTKAIDASFKTHKALGAAVLPRLAALQASGNEKLKAETGRRCNEPTFQAALLADVIPKVNAQCGTSYDGADSFQANVIFFIRQYGVPYDDAAAWRHFVANGEAFARWRAEKEYHKRDPVNNPFFVLPLPASEGVARSAAGGGDGGGGSSSAAPLALPTIVQAAIRTGTRQPSSPPQACRFVSRGR